MRSQSCSFSSKIVGFTLVELLIVIGILGVMLLVSAPFAGGWGDNARLIESDGLLQQVGGKAKAVALRNRFGMSGDQPAAAICVNAQVVTISEPIDANTPASCQVGSISREWQGNLPSGVSLTAATGTPAPAFSCLCLSNRGTPTIANTCNANCSTSNQIRILSGDDSESFTFY